MRLEDVVAEDDDDDDNDDDNNSNKVQINRTEPKNTKANFDEK